MPLDNPILLHALMLMLGVYCHFLKALMQKKKDGTPMTFHQYWIGNRYQAQISIIASVVAFFALMQMGELSMVTAWGAGFVCNSAADVMGSRTLDKL